jgi:hypothetical protein
LVWRFFFSGLTLSDGSTAIAEFSAGAVHCDAAMATLQIYLF